MKTVILILSLALSYPAYTNTKGTKEKPVYRQCIVQLPNGDEAGVCKETGDKYFQIFTCNGELLAFVEPGALPTIYVNTCGSNYKGYN